jgi:hypothetical protein
MATIRPGLPDLIETSESSDEEETQTGDTDSNIVSQPKVSKLKILEGRVHKYINIFW